MLLLTAHRLNAGSRVKRDPAFPFALEPGGTRAVVSQNFGRRQSGALHADGFGPGLPASFVCLGKLPKLACWQPALPRIAISHLPFTIVPVRLGLLRGHSSVGRAPALQAGSQGFESPCLQSTLAAAAESVDCRAVAFSEGGPLRPCERERGELRLGKPVPWFRSVAV